MTAPVAFKYRAAGGSVTDITGTWVDWETSVGCVKDWSGLIAFGPTGGDVMEFDWTDGADWEAGPRKPYSFDIPTAIYDGSAKSVYEAFLVLQTLSAIQGVAVTLRREFRNAAGTLVARHQCAGVLATDLSPRARGNRALVGSFVFQNISGLWTAVATT